MVSFMMYMVLSKLNTHFTHTLTVLTCKTRLTARNVAETFIKNGEYFTECHAHLNFELFKYKV